MLNNFFFKKNLKYTICVFFILQSFTFLNANANVIFIPFQSNNPIFKSVKNISKDGFVEITNDSIFINENFNLKKIALKDISYASKKQLDYNKKTNFAISIIASILSWSISKISNPQEALIFSAVISTLTLAIALPISFIIDKYQNYIELFALNETIIIYSSNKTKQILNLLEDKGVEIDE